MRKDQEPRFNAQQIAVQEQIARSIKERAVQGLTINGILDMWGADIVYLADAYGIEMPPPTRAFLAASGMHMSLSLDAKAFTRINPTRLERRTRELVQFSTGIVSMLEESVNSSIQETSHGKKN